MIIAADFNDSVPLGAFLLLFLFNSQFVTESMVTGVWGREPDSCHLIITSGSVQHDRSSFSERSLIMQECISMHVIQ